jgi:epoxyqueuosine reductase QueG
MDGKDLTNQLKAQAKELGADLTTVGLIERWTDPSPFDMRNILVYPHTGYLPTELMPSAQSIIVVAIRLLDGVVDTTITACKTTAVQGNFGYVYLNRRLHDISYGLAVWLEDRGYRSVPLGYNIGARYNHEADRDAGIIGPAYGLFSMKRAAVLSGLGRKARNGLVASPKLGTRMRLGAVLTTAKLKEDPLLEGEPCLPNCKICINVCPTQAITKDGKVSHLKCFSDTGRRGIHFDVIKTEFKKRYPPDLPDADYLMNDYMAIDGNGNRLCKNACVYMCPLGEHKIPDVVRRATDFEKNVPKVLLKGFPAAHSP